MQIISQSPFLSTPVSLYSMRKLHWEFRPDLTPVLCSRFRFSDVIWQRFFGSRFAQTENFPLSGLPDSMQCC